MSTYPPNNTTPKSPSGSYLWNWLGSPLKKFAAALAPYLGGGGGDGYTYKEVNISSAELINPPLFPQTSTNGILLLPITSNSYYKWNLVVEFLPGSTPYNIVAASPYIFDNILSYAQMDTTAISSNTPLAWQYSSEVTVDTVTTIKPNNESDINYLFFEWPVGGFTGGNGTMKVKIWYKVVNFG